MALALVAAPATASAATKPRFRVVGVGTDLSGDGGYGAWRQKDGDLALFDSANGSVRKIAPPAGCFGGSAGDGKVIWNCGEKGHGLVVDIKSGARTNIDTDQQTSGIDTTWNWVGVGPEWAALEATGYHFTRFPSYYNLRDRRTAYQDFNRPELVPDLDMPGLWRPLCAGLTQTRYDDHDVYPEQTRFRPYRYERPYGLEFVPNRVTLYRCGGRPPVVLGRTANPSIDLKGGLVAWTSGTRIWAYDVRRRQKTSWRIADFARGSVTGGPTVALTDGHLLVAMQVRGVDRVFAVRRPDRPTRTRR